MTTTLEKLEKLDEPILIDGLSWREFKVVEQLLSRPGVRLSFLDGVLEIRHINKLEDYKRLEIPEVWFWEKGALRMYSLGDDGYPEVDRSFVLPDLDIVLLVRCINIENHLQAMREFKQAIQSS